MKAKYLQTLLDKLPNFITFHPSIQEQLLKIPKHLVSMFINAHTLEIDQAVAYSIKTDDIAQRIIFTLETIRRNEGVLTGSNIANDTDDTAMQLQQFQKHGQFGSEFRSQQDSTVQRTLALYRKELYTDEQYSEGEVEFMKQYEAAIKQVDNASTDCSYSAEFMSSDLPIVKDITLFLDYAKFQKNVRTNLVKLLNALNSTSNTIKDQHFPKIGHPQLKNLKQLIAGIAVQSEGSISNLTNQSKIASDFLYVLKDAQSDKNSFMIKVRNAIESKNKDFMEYVTTIGSAILKDGKIDIVLVYDYLKGSDDDMKVLDSKVTITFKEQYDYEQTLRNFRSEGTEILNRLQRINTQLRTRYELFNGDFFYKRIAPVCQQLPTNIKDFHSLFVSSEMSQSQPITIKIEDINLLCDGSTDTDLGEILTNALGEIQFTQKVTVHGQSHRTVDSTPSNIYTNPRNTINAFADVTKKQGNRIINVLCTMVRDVLRYGIEELPQSIAKIMIKQSAAELMSNGGQQPFDYRYDETKPCTHADRNICVHSNPNFKAAVNDCICALISLNMLKSANLESFEPKGESSTATTAQKTCAVNYSTKIHDLCLKSKTFTQKILSCVGNLIASSCVNKVNTNHMAVSNNDTLVFLKEAIVPSNQSGMVEKKSTKRMSETEQKRDIRKLIDQEEIYSEDQVIAYADLLQHDLIHDVSILTIKEQFQRIVTQHETLILIGLVTQSGLIRIKTTPQAMNKILMLNTIVTHIQKTQPKTQHTLDDHQNNLNKLVGKLRECYKNGTHTTLTMRTLMHDIMEDMDQLLAYQFGIYIGIVVLEHEYARRLQVKDGDIQEILDINLAELTKDNNLQQTVQRNSIASAPSLRKHIPKSSFNDGLSNVNSNKLSLQQEQMNRSQTAYPQALKKLNNIMRKIDHNLELNIDFSDVVDYASDMARYNKLQEEVIQEIKTTSKLKEVNEVRDEILKGEIHAKKGNDKDELETSKLINDQYVKSKKDNKQKMFMNFQGNKLVTEVSEEEHANLFEDVKIKIAQISSAAMESSDKQKVKDRVQEEQKDRLSEREFKELDKIINDVEEEDIMRIDYKIDLQNKNK